MSDIDVNMAEDEVITPAFLSKLNHELRSPLSAVTGFSELGAELAMNGDHTRDADYFKKINRAGQNLLAIMNDISTIAMIESRRLVLAPADFDLGNWLATLRNDKQAEAAAKHNILTLGSHPLSCVVKVDGERLRQLVTILVSNAMKFTENGTITLSWQCDGDQLRIAVADTGQGIALSDHETVFLPFARAGGKSKGSGAGLGLFVARQLVTLMGGQVAIASEIGVGSTFTLSVPVAPAGIST